MQVLCRANFVSIFYHPLPSRGRFAEIAVKIDPKISQTATGELRNMQVASIFLRSQSGLEGKPDQIGDIVNVQPVH